jgi:hypothetical protein
MGAPFGLSWILAGTGLMPGSWTRRELARDMIGFGKSRLTMIASHLLERNYKLMNRFFLAVSITILTSTFTNPTMF